MPDESAPSAQHGILWDLQHGDRAKWIGVGIAAVSLVVAFLIFRRGSQSSASSVYPVSGSGTLGSGATGGGDSGALGSLISAISAQNAQTQQEIASLQNPQSPSNSSAPGTFSNIWAEHVSGQQPIFASPGGPNEPPWSQWLANLPKGSEVWVDLGDKQLGYQNTSGGYTSPWWAPVFAVDPRQNPNAQPIGWEWLGQDAGGGWGGITTTGPAFNRFPGHVQADHLPSDQVRALNPSLTQR